MPPDQILRCPFCGGEAVLEEVGDGASVRFSVGCETDGGGTDICMGYQSLTTFDRRSDAIKAWNRRAALSPPQPSERDTGLEKAARRLLDIVTLDGDPPALAVPAAVDSEKFTQACDELFRTLKSTPTTEPDDWQPIETAPKGRLLLVGFFNSAGKWRSAHAQYRDDLPQDDMAEVEDEPAPAGWYEGSLEAEMLFPITPTHWRPLPAPPALKSTPPQGSGE